MILLSIAGFKAPSINLIIPKVLQIAVKLILHYSAQNFTSLKSVLASTQTLK